MADGQPMPLLQHHQLNKLYIHTDDAIEDDLFGSDNDVKFELFRVKEMATLKNKDEL